MTESLEAIRSLFTNTMAFYVVFAVLSVGLSMIISALEWRARSDDDKLLRSTINLFAKWSAVFIVGTAFIGLSVLMQLATLWAPFIEEVRLDIGVYIQLAAVFSVAALSFLGWYLATMDQVGKQRHFLVGLVVNAGMIGSLAAFVLVDSYMNNPLAVFTLTTLLEIILAIAGSAFTVVLLVLGYAVYRSLRSREERTEKFLAQLINHLTIYAGVLLVVIVVVAGVAYKDIADTQPQKLAALELLDKTQTNAPLRVGGQINESGKAEGGLVIPGMLSLLVGFNPNTEVEGLGDTPPHQWPPLIVHTYFGMLRLLALLLVAAAGLVAWYRWKKRELPGWLYVSLVPMGLVGLVLAELVWLINDVGRQTWMVTGRLTTEMAVSRDATIFDSLASFEALYVVLVAASLFALAYTTHHWRSTEKKLSW